MIKKTLVMLLSMLAGASVFFAVLGRSGVQGIFTSLRSFSPFYLFLFLITTFLIGLLTVFRWSMILRHMGYRLPIRKLFVYRAISFAIGYVTPSARMGGEPVRAILISRHHVPIDKAYASIVLDKILDLSMGAAVMSVALFFSLIAFRFPPGVTLFFVAIIVGSTAAFFVVYSRLLRKKGLLSRIFELTRLSRISLFKKINQHVMIVEEYSGDFLRSRKYVAELLLISAVMWVLFILEFKIVLLIVGFNASILQIFLVMLFFGMAIILPIPASLGVLEAGQAYAFTLLQAGPSLGIAVAFVLRFKDLMWTFFGLTMFSRRGLRKIPAFKPK